MTTAYDTPAEWRQLATGPLGDLVIAILGRGVDPHIVEMEPHQCEWCAEVDAIATVRVYGQPRADVLAPVELVEVCGLCAPDLIARARSEARDDAGDIVIEVAA